MPQNSDGPKQARRMKSSPQVRKRVPDRLVREALTRQSDTLGKHEKKISDHTGIQTWTLLFGTVVSAVTTVALIYIAYQQYVAANLQANVAEREVKLQYAQVAPIFRGEMEYREDASHTRTGPVRFPVNIKLSLVRGVADIRYIDVIQDIETAVSPSLTSSGLFYCNVRVSNYWQRSSDMTFAAHPKVFNIATDTSRLYGDQSFMSVEPGYTYVTITFNDLFGDTRKVTLRDRDGVMVAMPNNDTPPRVNFMATSSAKLAPGAAASFPKLWEPTHSKDRACDVLTFNLQR